MQKFTIKAGSVKANDFANRFPQVFQRVVILILLTAAFMLNKGFAQLSNVPVSGFNNDIVANGGGTNGSPNTGLSYPAVGCDGAGYSLVQQGYTAGAATPTCFMPVSNTAPSLLTPGLTYSLQGYGTSAINNNNALTIAAPSSTYSSPFPASATLTLTTPAKYMKLYALLMSICNNSTSSQTMTATVNFSDATTEVFSNTFANWFSGSAATTAFLQFNRLNPNNGGFTNSCAASGYTTQPNMFEMNLSLSPSNYNKLVSSITFTSTTAITGTGSTPDKVNYLHIFSVGGMVPCVTPSSQATTFTPGSSSISQLSASFTAAAGTPSGYLTVRYPTGGTPTAPVDGISYTAGQSLGAGTIIQASNAVSFTASGLTGSTTYDFYTYSYNSGSCGGPVYLTGFPLTGTMSTTACGILSGVIPVGPTAPASPAGFATLTAANVYINANGLGGSTILELQADYTTAYAAANETYPITFPVNACINNTRPLTIRPASGVSSVITLTSASTSATFIFDGGTYITIDGRPGGTGTNKFISIVNSSTTAGSAGNAILLKNEASNNTLTYLDVQSANTNAATSSTVVAAGSIPGAIAIGTTPGQNGNDNNTISFCNIHSTGTNLTVGIYAGNGTTAGTAANNDNNVITDNNVYDFFHATIASAAVDIAVGNNNFSITNNRVYQSTNRTFTGTQAVRGFWITPNTSSLTSASGFVISGNTIGYSAANATGTYTMTGTSAWTFTGIDLSVGLGTATSIQNNVITNINETSGTTTSLAMVGINVANGNVDIGTITRNLVGSTTGTGAISFTASANAGGIIGIRVGTGGTINISNNIIAGIDLLNSTTSVTTVFNGIAASGGTTINITNNTIGSLTVLNSINALSASTSTSANAIRGIFVNGGTTSTISGNTIANMNTNYSTTGTQASTMGGIYVTLSTSTITGNTISNLSSATQTTASGVASGIVGIAYTATTAPMVISGNTIHSLRLTNALTTAAVQITGIFISGPISGSNIVSKNNLHSFSLANAANTTATFTGITVGGGAASYTNNMIRLGYDALGNPVTAGIQLRGFTKGIALVNNFYHNSVFIGGAGVASGSNTFAFQRSTAPASGSDIIQNNIFVNNRSNTTTGGKHYVFSASANTLLNLNYNAYQYTGTGAVFGLNSAADVAVYTTNWTGGDANSQVGNPKFINPTGTATTGDLHLIPATNSIAESNGIVIAAVTDDIDGNTRQGAGGYSGTGTSPDLGADEYEGVTALPVLNSTSVSPNTAQCIAAAHTVTVDITAAPGTTLSAVTLNYTVNGVTQTGIAMSLSSGSANATSIWNGTISVPTPANGTVSWTITATDGTFSKTFPGGSYADEPLTGATAVITSSVNPTCAGSPTVLTAYLVKPGPGTIGTGSTTSATYSNPVYSGFSNNKMQIIYLASELRAKGFAAGNFTALSINLTATNTTARSNFTIQMAHTTATAVTTTFLTPVFTQVYTNAAYNPATGTNTFNFGTGVGSSSVFNWDGLSNIVIQTCWDNTTATTSLASTCSADNAGFNCVVSYNRSALMGTSICGQSLPGLSTYTIRPTITFTGMIGPVVPITSVSWSDGTNTIATANPLTVNPTTTASYTAVITAAGCPITSNTISQAVNTLPAPPNGNNSNQCGVGQPSAFVTSGGAGGGFKWYDAQTGGNLVQNGGFQYAGTVDVTTVFWVSESNGTCESPRIQVVANVSDADDITASVSNSHPCINSSILLTATDIATPPLNNYTYSWAATPEAGSGITDTIVGTQINVIPTTPGTYTYTVTGVDNICIATSQVVVTVNPLPEITSVTATPASICPGATSSLQAMTLSSPGTAQYGTSVGTLTTLGNPYRASDAVGTQVKNQLMIRASELTSGGLAAGAIINSLSFTTSTAAGSSINFEIRMGLSSSTVLTTSFLPTSATVFSAPTFTPAPGVNTHVFTTPFVWDGTSSLVIEVRQVIASTGTCIIASYSPGFTGNVQAASSTGFSAATGSTNTSRPIMKLGYTNNITNFSTWQWSPGALAGSAVSVSPTTTTVFTATATSPATGCTSSQQVTVTVNPVPLLPSANNSEQCGSGIPAAYVSSNSGAVSPIFNWYDAPLGGTLLQSGTSASYSSAVSSSTTFYVSEISAEGCEGARVPLVVTISDADTITAVASSTTICNGNSFDISATYIPNFNAYSVYELTAVDQPGSGVTGAVSLVPNASGADPYTITPTAAGTYTYSITGFDPDRGCTSTGSITVTVAALPQITTATASPLVICAGVSSTLSATSIATTTLAASTGAGATDLTGGENPFRASNSNKHFQAMVKATELTALGFSAGNISKLAFEITTIDPVYNSYSNFSIKLAQTANTSMSSFVTTGLTQVFFAATYTEILGINSFTFTTPFAWNGTSNIVVDICYGDADINASILSSCKGDVASFTSSIKTATGAPTASSLACSNTSTNVTSSTSRPTMKFTIDAIVNITDHYNWTWNPGGISTGATGTTSVNPLTTTTYTVTAMDPVSGCSSSSSPVTVTVNQLPGNPIASNSIQCGLAVPTASVTSGGGGNGVFKWYANPSGGTALQTGVSATYNTAIANTTIFYVSESSAAGCESGRTAVTVTVTNPPAVDVSGSTTSVCVNGSALLNVTSAESNYTYTWTGSPAAGSGITGSLAGSSTGSSSNSITPTAAGTYTYTVIATEAINNCTTTGTVVITVKSNPVISGVSSSPTTICAGATATLTATLTPAYSNVPVTGFNNDIVANGIGTTNTSSTGSMPGVTYPVNGVDGAGYTFVDNTYKWYPGASAFPTCGLPSNNQVPSSLTPGLTYTLQSYSANNALTVGSNTFPGSIFPTTGTLNLLTPTTCAKLFVLYESVMYITGPTVTATVTFTDATTQVFSGNAMANWFTNTGTVYSNMQRAQNTAPGTVSSCGSGPYLFQMTLPISAANQSKLVESITFNWSTLTGTAINAMDYIHVMSIAKQATADLTWNPGAINGNAAIVNPTATTTYTATLTDASTGCSTNSTPVTVTVNPLPPAPVTTTDITKCGPQNISFTATGTGGQLKWYNVSSGGSSIFTGSTYTTMVIASTNFWVAETSAAGCEGPRTQVNVTITAAPFLAITAGGTTPICQNSSLTLNGAIASDTSYINYNWSASPAIGSGLVLNSGSIVTVTPTATGTYTYTVVADDGNPDGCTNTTSIVVTVNAVPVITSVTANPTTICAGGTASLTASTSTIAPFAATLGTQSTTIGGSTGSPYRSGSGVGNQVKGQFLYRALDLTNAGFTAGSITGLGFNCTTTTGTNTNMEIRIGSTTTTALTGTFLTSSMQTVFTASSFTPVAGLNMHTFTTPFVWDGVSNIIVEERHITTSASTTSTASANSPGYTATIQTTGSTAFIATIGTTSTARPLIRFAGFLGSDHTNDYSWQWNPGAINGSSVNVSPAVITAYTVTATNPVTGCSAIGAPVTVNVNQRPTAVISGGAIYCEGQGSTATTLSIAVTGNGPWSGTLSNGIAFNGTSSPILVTVTPVSTTTFSVATLNDANCSANTTDLSGSATVTINPLAANPIVSVTQPTCSVATGIINVTAPVGAGNSYTLDGATTITWPNVDFPAVAPGPHMITVINSFGCSAPASASIIVNPQPFIPAAPIVTGIVNVCPHIGTGEELTYTATATGNGTQLFHWTLPPNVTLISGGGTNTIVVKFPSFAFTTQGNKQIRLTVTNDCGTSPMSIFYLVAQAPTTPNPITGPTDLCPLLGSAAGADYTINKANGALYYVWNVPGNGTTATVTHPYTGVNDTTIHVIFGAGFPTSTITVQAFDSCGGSGLRSLMLNRTIPSTPGLITGPTNACNFIAPGGTVATYSVMQMQGVTYNWTVPMGAIGFTGQGTNTISFKYPAGFASGSVSVTATNACGGPSASRTLAITSLNPATPSVIDIIQTHFCGEEPVGNSRVFTYTLAAMPSNAASILWTIPTASGAVLEGGQGTTSITVRYPDGAVNGTLSAQAISNCGSSSIRSTTIKLPACPPPGFTRSEAANSNIQPKVVESLIPTATEVLDVKIFPNPTVSDFKLEVLTSGSEEINVRIMDQLGRLYRSFKVMPNQTIALGAELKAGSYLIEVRQGLKTKTKKIVKF